MSESALFEIKKQQFLDHKQKKPFPDHYDTNHTLPQALCAEVGTQDIRVAGRVVGLRVMGKLLFAHIQDFFGKIQICVKQSQDGHSIFKDFVDEVSIGDFIGVCGELFVTKTGETTLRVQSYLLLNKALRTLPEKYHGIEDTETCYRQRYLDLVMSPESRQVFKTRLRVVQILRHFLEQNEFWEVETPILQTLPSGALATPFTTHHKALGMDCTLRIAPETFLKRCNGAGLPRVYEFARCFRNEGISATHLQDFTMLEFYACYWNRDNMLTFVQKMIKMVIETVVPDHILQWDGHSIDVSGAWPTYEYSDVIFQHCGIDIGKDSTRESLLSSILAKNIALENVKTQSWATLVDSLYKKVVRPFLTSPCFLVKYPKELAPLARENATDPQYVDLLQLVIGGVELVKAYSEIVDPLEQRERFEQQAQARAYGDTETLPYDTDFLLAMEHGFPPIAGCGIGIDRLIMMLCGCKNIKDTVLFPLLRPL